MRRLLVVLDLASLAIVSAKTYEISLSAPTKAGSVQLKAGVYKLKVDGSNATFTEVNSQKSFTTPVKVQTADKKFEDTTVQATKDNEGDRINEIDLGGSTTKLGF
jgi:hypothetical protein